MILNFVPDGKSKGMSILSHDVNAAETAGGKKTEGGAAAAAAGK